MIFLSDTCGRVEVRLYIDDVAPAGRLIRTADGGLDVAPPPASSSIGPAEDWLQEAGLEVFERRRRGRRWIVRARLPRDGLDG